MSSDLNRAEFIGRLGRDAELVNTSTGNAMCKFSLAVNEEYLDSTGQKVKTTEWINCVSFGKLADVCVRFLKKGARAYVAGKFKVNKYVTKEGLEKQSFQIHVQDLQILTFVDDDTPHHTEDKVDEDLNDDIPF